MTPSPLPPGFAGPVGPAWTATRLGQIRAAGQELHRLLLPETAATLSSPQLALALLLQVDVDLAVGEITSATGHAGRLGLLSGPVATLAGTLASGETSAAYGDHVAARDQFLAAGSLPGAEEVLLRPWWVGAVPALVRTGGRSRGAELARERVALAEQQRDPFALAHGLRALATAESGNDPLGRLQRAHRLAVQAGSRRLAMQLDTDIAALSILSPGGGRAEPEIATLLRRAETYAGTEGLWPLHARVVALLARIGERAHPVAGRVLDVLTPAEQRVARLAGRELTNREIAAALGIGVKGVEWHLSRIYRKLGIASRDALVGLLDEVEEPAGADDDAD